VFPTLLGIPFYLLTSFLVFKIITGKRYPKKAACLFVFGFPFIVGNSALLLSKLLAAFDFHTAGALVETASAVGTIGPIILALVVPASSSIPEAEFISSAEESDDICEQTDGLPLESRVRWCCNAPLAMIAIIAFNTLIALTAYCIRQDIPHPFFFLVYVGFILMLATLSLISIALSYAVTQRLSHIHWRYRSVAFLFGSGVHLGILLCLLGISWLSIGMPGI
tara:strand:- start:110 stop:778 length:669 start_codon:yes stop_codon:yes gene_type:complete